MGSEFRILTVCTGNVCRSPAAEVLLRRGLGRDVVVESAGTQALVDRPMDPVMADTLAPRGVTPDGFVARLLEAEMVERADLVLAMTREHRSAVVTLVPTAMRRTFTLAEFATLLETWEEDGRVRPFYTVRVEDRLREFMAVAATRRGRVRPAAESDLDVPDPFMLAPEVYQDSVQRIAAAVDTIVGCLDGSGPAPRAPRQRAVAGAQEQQPAGSERGLRGLLRRLGRP